MPVVYRFTTQYDTSNYSFGYNKELKVKRCPKCNLLYNTKIKYPQESCFLCLYDKNPTKGNEILKKYNKTFEEYRDNLLKMHKDIERRMQNDYDARKCKWINKPICKRVENN